MFNSINYNIMKTVRYWRNPTDGEIQFGYGAIHYVDFPMESVLKKDGKIKKWFIKNGKRYNFHTILK